MVTGAHRLLNTSKRAASSKETTDFPYAIPIACCRNLFFFSMGTIATAVAQKFFKMSISFSGNLQDLDFLSLTKDGYSKRVDPPPNLDLNHSLLRDIILTTKASIPAALPASVTTQKPPAGAGSGHARCKIAAFSGDGIGHQLESKLSCIGVAAILNFEYVHMSFPESTHYDNKTYMDEFMGLRTIYPPYQEEMKKEKRETPWVGHCNEVGWLRAVELGKKTCASDTVYFSDNCWDRFYCNGLMESGAWYKLVPEIQKAYYTHPKPDAEWHAGFADPPLGLHVAVHIRRDDGASNDLNLFVQAMNDLRKQLSEEGQPAPLFRVQTDDKASALIAACAGHCKPPGLTANDTMIDDRFHTSLYVAFHRMVTADAFIMSRSALSMSAALIGNQSIVMIPFTCWDRTALPHWTKLQC